MNDQDSPTWEDSGNLGKIPKSLTKISQILFEEPKFQYRNNTWTSYQAGRQDLGQ